MEAYQQRVVDEESQLREKFEKLEVFLGDKFSKSLPKIDLELLHEQRGYMSGYLSVLKRRIDRFNTTTLAEGI